MRDSSHRVGMLPFKPLSPWKPSLLGERIRSYSPRLRRELGFPRKLEYLRMLAVAPGFLVRAGLV